MLRSLRTALAAVLLVLGAPCALAGGLVQLRFEGVLETGHLVEVEVAHGDADQRLVLHLHLARGTTGAELAKLVAARLETEGARVTTCIADGREGKSEAGSLFVDDVRGIALRLGAGLVAEVACTEGAPASVRVERPAALEGDLGVEVAASAAIPRTGKAPLRRRVTLDVDLPKEATSVDVATALWQAAEEEWMTERNGGAGWRPIKLLDGSLFTGLSVRLASKADWRLEIEV